MCKIGDIIVIKQFKGQDGQIVHRHSFVVISDKNGYIEGLKYDFISNMLTSFHSEEHKQKKLSYKENLEIIERDIIGYKTHTTKPGFVKDDQLYYFNKKIIKYEVIGKL